MATPPFREGQDWGRYLPTQVGKSLPSRSLHLCHARFKAKGTVRETRSFLQKLEGAERGLELIERTPGRDDRRVMLAYLFRDLDALRAEVPAVAPALRARYLSLAHNARKVRGRLGTPIEPDEDPGPIRRRRKRRKPCPED